MVYLHYEIELLRFAADCSSINTQVLKDWSKCVPFKNSLNLNFYKFKLNWILSNWSLSPNDWWMKVIQSLNNQFELHDSAKFPLLQTYGKCLTSSVDWFKSKFKSPSIWIKELISNLSFHLSLILECNNEFSLLNSQ